MPAQYDNIGSKYAVFKTLPTSIIERENVKQAILPYLSKFTKPRVLDLACGTGYYSKRVIDWGADYVLGVDISAGMVNAATDTLTQETEYAGKVNFKVGDALSLGKVEGEEPFDIVMGAWLLNYASTLDEMTRMIESISANLKDGGVYIGLGPMGSEDIDGLAKLWMDIQADLPDAFPVRVDYYERLESGLGWKVEVSNTVGGEKISFRNFHIKQSVYEEGARRGGLRGKLTWPEVTIPEEARIEGVWEVYARGGKHIGIFIVEK